MALVAVGLVMAVVAIWNLRSVQDQVAKASAFSDSTARVLEVSTHLQAIQRANLRYIYDASEPAMKEAAERETAATELLKVGAQGTLSEERRKLYNDLVADIAKMRSLRDNLGDAVNEARTGKATLLPSGDELTVKMGKLVDVARAAVDEDTGALVADLESRLLLVQIANWRFLALRDTKGPANFRTNVDRASQRLSALEKSPQAAELRTTLAPVKTSLGIYKSAFETTSAAMLQADEIYHKNLAPLIVDSIAKLKVAEAALKKDYKESRSQAEAVIDGTTTVQEIAGGLATLFGLIVAFLIARSIVGPLTSMTRAMGLLAGGNLEVEIPGRGKADEIGDMAKAIEVFKTNMIDTERLRTEQTETEARQAENRKADMVRLADQFEQAVGEIVDTVSSASSELEASAGTLTTTASARPGSVDGSRQRLPGGLGQRAGRCLRDRGAVLLGHARSPARCRNPPASPARPWGRQADQRTRRRAVQGGRPHRRRGRADQHHRRPDQSAGAERDHRGGACGRGRPRLCRGRLRGQGAGRADREGHGRDRPADLRASRPQPSSRSAPSGRSAAPSSGCRRSRRRLRRPWKSRAPRRRKSPATSSRPPMARSASRPISATSSAAPPRPARPPRRCSRRRARCRPTATG